MVLRRIYLGTTSSRRGLPTLVCGMKSYVKLPIRFGETPIQKTQRGAGCCYWPAWVRLHHQPKLRNAFWSKQHTSTHVGSLETCKHSLLFGFRFVSDHAYNGFKAVGQQKLIQAMQKSLYGPETARTYPLSLLEWTANRKKANMVLQVHCFDGVYQFHLHCLSFGNLHSVFAM